jgi:hypothetical protein
MSNRSRRHRNPPNVSWVETIPGAIGCGAMT